MVFHSTAFLFFFIPVLLIHWSLDLKNQNRWLLFTSYLFYGLWDWRFVTLLALTSLANAYLGKEIQNASAQERKQRYLTFSVFLNLLALGIFKYFNFFMEGFFRLFQMTEGKGSAPLFHILLPLGISFYTFKAISYCVDIYRGQIKPVKQFSDLALYLAFFPQIISGPIDRPSLFLPQLTSPRKVTRDDFYRGFFLIAWGLFQKLFIADNLGSLVNPVFQSHAPYESSQVFFALYVYAFQLYCDFAGYSHMAWGIAKLLGFETTQNFNLPFFSTSIQHFWNRWHISLSLWIKDYLYTPVFMASGRLPTLLRLYWATLVSMFFIGLWHGAGWNYIFYGVYHGILLCLYAMIRPWLKQNVNPKQGMMVFLWQWIRILFVFHLAAVGFLIFRAESCSQFFHMMRALTAGFPFYTVPAISLFQFIFFIGIALIVEYSQYARNDRWAVFQWHPGLRAIFYILCFFMLSVHGASGAKEFIYFQF